MPYQKLSGLPESVQNVLPKHAQEIYRAAFNSAEEQYADEANTETRAHKVAWSAVKNEYHKNEDGTWVTDADTNKQK